MGPRISRWAKKKKENVFRAFKTRRWVEDTWKYTFEARGILVCRKRHVDVWRTRDSPSESWSDPLWPLAPTVRVTAGVAHPIAAGADNAFACVPCVPGTYSTSSGACRGASCCVCTSDALRHACACVYGVEQIKLRGVSKEKRPFLNSPLFLLGTVPCDFPCDCWPRHVTAAVAWACRTFSLQALQLHPHACPASLGPTAPRVVSEGTCLTCFRVSIFALWKCVWARGNTESLLDIRYFLDTTSRRVAVVIKTESSFWNCDRFRWWCCTERVMLP